jgi:glycosyltransferase involved in cell wall biosynthesis
MVNGWHYKSAWQTMHICWKTNTPVMARSDSHLLEGRSILKRLLKWPGYRWFIPRLDACLPVGTWSREYFLHYGAPPELCFVVPHTVDSDLLRQQAAQLRVHRHTLRAGWSLDEDDIVYLFAGKFVEKKRPLDFVRAVAHARKNGAAISGLMVGDGPLRRDCETLAASEGVPIRFTGFLNQSRMAAGYCAADALVLPSDGRETWGLVVNEAMACGLPCFVSDRVGCGPDLIQPGDTGDVFPVGDTRKLAQLLHSCSRERLETMGRRASGKACTLESAVAGIVQAVNHVTV